MELLTEAIKLEQDSLYVTVIVVWAQSGESIPEHMRSEGIIDETSNHQCVLKITLGNGDRHVSFRNSLNTSFSKDKAAVSENNYDADHRKKCWNELVFMNSIGCRIVVGKIAKSGMIQEWDFERLCSLQANSPLHTIIIDIGSI